MLKKRLLLVHFETYFMKNFLICGFFILFYGCALVKNKDNNNTSLVEVLHEEGLNELSSLVVFYYQFDNSGGFYDLVKSAEPSGLGNVRMSSGVGEAVCKSSDKWFIASSLAYRPSRDCLLDGGSSFEKSMDSELLSYTVGKHSDVEFLGYDMFGACFLVKIKKSDFFKSEKLPKFNVDFLYWIPWGEGGLLKDWPHSSTLPKKGECLKNRSRKEIIFPYKYALD